MSSSTDTSLVRGRILRDAPVHASVPLQDLDEMTEAARQVVDPAAMAQALAQGYEDGRARGHADGYDAGRAAALEEADRHRAEQDRSVQRALAALAAATDELRARRDETVAGLEDTLVSGALELAEAVVGRELELAAAPGRDALARALRLAEGMDAAVARLHPDDVATLGDPAELAPGRQLTVVPDPSVERGGCLVQIGDGSVDARISAALDRVRKVLTS